MVEHPADLFFSQNSLIINIGKYVSTIHLYTMRYKRKMSDGARWVNAECPMVQEIWQDLQGLLAPFTLNFTLWQVTEMKHALQRMEIFRQLFKS